MGVLPFEGGAEQRERGALSARKGHESSPRSQFDRRGEEARAEGTESFCPILPPYFALSGKRMSVIAGLEESWSWVGNSTKNTAGTQ